MYTSTSNLLDDIVRSVVNIICAVEEESILDDDNAADEET